MAITKAKPAVNGTATAPKETTATISAPQMGVLAINIIGTAPYVQLRFPMKARNMMLDKMAQGNTAKGKKQREARDYEQEFQDSLYRLEDGGFGIPAAAFRNAAIRACAIVGFQMTKAKMSIFIQSDGGDVNDATPLVRIIGTPELRQDAVRNATGVADIRTRAMFREWSATVNVRFDMEQFTAADVVNLFARVGLQVGIGEGRHFSKDSAGMGWGEFILGDIQRIQ